MEEVMEVIQIVNWKLTSVNFIYIMVVSILLKKKPNKCDFIMNSDSPWNTTQLRIQVCAGEGFFIFHWAFIPCSIPQLVIIYWVEKLPPHLKL